MSGYTSAIAVITAVVSAGVGAYSSVAQGEAQKEQADYQAKINENNAKIAEMQQIDEQNRAAAAYAEKIDDKRRIIATQRARSGGVEADSGTFGQLQDETSTLAGLDALKLLNNGQRSAWGLEVDQNNSLAQASANRMAGNQAVAAGQIGAASSLLSGAANAMSIYSKSSSTTKPQSAGSSIGSKVGAWG
jgi:hypothetical protein